MKTSHTSAARIPVLLALITLPVSLSASAEEITELRRQIAVLTQRLDDLERKAAHPPAEIACPDERVPAPGPTAAAVRVDTRGIQLAGTDGRRSFRVRANVQTDARFYINDGGIPNNDGFLLRRVRPILEGTLDDRIRFRIMPDFAPDTPTLLDAWAEVKLADSVGFLVGRSKSPLSLERLVSQTALQFVERAYPASLLPNRDVGFHLRGKAWDGRLDWQVGVQKGAPDGASASSSAIRDDDPEVVARVFAHPFAKLGDTPLKGLGLGFAVARDRAENVAPSNYRTLAQQTFFSWGAGTIIDGEVLRWSPQGYWYHGPYGLLAEYAVSSQELVRGGQAARLTNRAWQVAVNWVLTGEDAAHRGVSPKSQFDPGAGTWGAWEVAARLSGLSVDRAAFPNFADLATSAREVLTATVGINWFPHSNLKLVANYETSGFTGGVNGTVTARREHAIFTRVQVSF